MILNVDFTRKNDLYSEWRAFYIDYNLLKRELKVYMISGCLNYPTHAIFSVTNN